MTQDIRKGIMTRVYLVYRGDTAFRARYTGKGFLHPEFRKKQLLEMAKKQEMQIFPIEAIRGNILSDDGSLLAVSVPIFDLRMDLDADSLTDEVFENGIDSLAKCLAGLYQDRFPHAGQGQIMGSPQKPGTLFPDQNATLPILN